MECNVKYHIERYLDSKGIHVDILEYKFEDIRDLVQQCRLGDVEAGRQIPAAEEHARVTNVPTTPPQTGTVPSASYSGSTAYSSSGTPTSISRVPSPSADDSGSPLPKGNSIYRVGASGYLNIIYLLYLYLKRRYYLTLLASSFDKFIRFQYLSFTLRESSKFQIRLQTLLFKKRELHGGDQR